MAIDTLLQLFAKIFIMVAVGYFLRRRNIITVQIKQALNFMIVNVFMPFSILVSGNSAFSREMSHSLLLVAGLSLIYYIASMVIGMGLGKLFHMEEHRARIFVLLQSFANVGFLGIPLAEELFGATGTLVAVVYNLAFDVIFFTYGMYYVRHGGKLDLKALLGNVVAISAIASVILYCSPVRMPVLVEESLRMMGSCTTPLSMIVVGCSLAEVKLSDVLKSRDAYLVSALRLVIYPVLFWAAAVALHLESEVTAAGILLTALPPATMNVIVAEEHGCAPEFAAQAVVQSMVFMIVTVPVVMMILG